MSAARAVIVPIAPVVSPVAIKRILYATDFSPASRAALPLLSALARRYKAEIYVENVRPPVPYALSSPEAVCTVENRGERDARAEMDKLSQTEELKGLATNMVVESGDPAEEITRTVRDLNIDLTILGTHGRTGLMRLLMGSLAEELFRNLPCPVLTVGPRLGRRFEHPDSIKTIICATDLSAESRLVFPVVESLAAEYKSRIVLFHSISSENARSIKARDMAADRRAQIRRMFCGGIGSQCDFDINVDFGDPAERILSCAREHQAELIAFGVRQAGEASTHFRNTVGYKIVLESECPVLTCRAPQVERFTREEKQ